jgi:hypothetical protein
MVERQYDSPYWVQPRQLEYFGVEASSGELPAVIRVKSGEVCFYNAEQTSNPLAFNAKSCNNTLEPLILPGAFFGPTFRLPRGIVGLVMSWAAARENLFTTNVWVQQKHLAMLRLSYNGKYSQLLFPTAVGQYQFLNYDQIVEQQKLAFLARYSPRMTNGKRLFGHEAIQLSLTAYINKLSSPFWVPARRAMAEIPPMAELKALHVAKVRGSTWLNVEPPDINDC